MMWEHDELAADLASHLRGEHRMVWLNMQLGPSGSPRPDVYTLYKSYVAPCPIAYECKVSVADFRADVTAAKWSTYLEYAHAVVFAAPADLLRKDDIPGSCGLILRHKNAWRMAKKPIPVPRVIAQEALLKLLIDGVRREGAVERRRQWDAGAHTRDFDARFGATAARYVADAASIERDLAYAEEQRAKIVQRAEQDAARIREKAASEAPPLWASLVDCLGLPGDAELWNVKHAIAKLRTEKAGGREASELRRILRLLRNIVQANEDIADEVFA